jgi:hypothetical protein
MDNDNFFMTDSAAKNMSRAQRRRFEKLIVRVEKATQADARFFERFPYRQHRVHLAARAEIERDALLSGAGLHIPREFSYFMAVKNIAPGVRLRLRIIGLEGSDTDVSEEVARAIYEGARTPEAEKLEQHLAGLCS